MSFTEVREFTVWCDVPGCRNHESFVGTKPEAWRHAFAKGWRRLRPCGKDVHLCPECPAGRLIIEPARAAAEGEGEG